MHLKHLKPLLEPQLGASKICCMGWSPNNNKLAVCTSDRVVLLYDENGERRDKFSSKPIDSKYGKKSYSVKALAFSPCSTKIALGQSDNIIYVYRVGEEWGEKKIICNKFIQTSAVTSLIWPLDNAIVYGIAEGKVRLANTLTNKASTIYATDSYVVSLASNQSGKGIISGHADGTLIRYFFDDEGTGDAQGKIITHSCAPYALAWATNNILVGGCDRKVVVYSREGRSLQTFDYSRDNTEKEFTTAVCNPSGQSVVVGSYDRLRLFTYSQRKSLWDEAKPKNIKNLYTITALSWKKDGSRLCAGTLCGGVEIFDCCLRRSIFKNKFEMTYVGLSQVIVKNMSTGTRVVLKSHYGYEITDVKILGGDRYLVANTSDTLLLGDLLSNRLSEVTWQGSGGNEKYFFQNETVCMIFNAGELTLVEYGSNEILGSVRTELMNPHLISVRLNERQHSHKTFTDNKKMAYLIDAKTVSIVDLTQMFSIATIQHNSKLDWLELNETGRKLLFRDKRLQLHMYDLETEVKSTLLSYCSFVQWVPQSDVLVAQNRESLCVWYNIDAPERVTMFPIKGEIIQLERVDGKTEVLVQEGVNTVTYTLDEGLIEFGTAIDDGDFNRATAFLETLEMSPETEAMWRTLCKLALENCKLPIAERCCAALRDVSKAKYLKELSKMVQKYEVETGGDGINYYKVQAKIAILEKNFKKVEQIYLENGAVDECIEFYKSVHLWTDAINLAQSRNHSDLKSLQMQYYDWLISTNQDGAAGLLLQQQQDYTGAISLYMKAGLPARAAKLAFSRSELLSNRSLMEQIVSGLLKYELYEQAGELYEKVGDYQRALECYRNDKAFRRAVDLARSSFPSEVVRLELEWANHLSSQKQLDAAINHYIEAGATSKAVEAAIGSRQFSKANVLLEGLDSAESAKYFHQIALHYSQSGDHKKSAEFFIRSGSRHEAVELLLQAGSWEQAHQLAQTCMAPQEIQELYANTAQSQQDLGKYREAERLYLTIGESESVITMYKKLQRYDDMMRLVASHHPEILHDTHIHLAKELESQDLIEQAQHHYIKGGDWKTAVNMFRQRNMWEEAYKVAKEHGSGNAHKQVAFLWARTLGGDSAVKLLNRFNLLETAIDYAADNCSFDFAFDLAKTVSKDKTTELHLKYAMYLEDEGKFQQAEAEFVEAGKAKEAVLMYIHNQDWQSAERVATNHDPESVNDVLCGQGRLAFEQKEFQQGETHFLRAHRADLIVKNYRELGMWNEALHICREYLPNKYDQLQLEYEQQVTKKGASGVQTLIQQGQECEARGEYSQAIGWYCKVNQEVTHDSQILEKCWSKASELALKFLPNNKATAVVQLLAPKFVQLNRHSKAAELYVQVDMIQEAADCLMEANEFEKAKNMCKNYAPDLESYVDEKYKLHLKHSGDIKSMVPVDVMAALDMYVESGQWEKCIETAEEQGDEILHKYVALYAAHLLKDQNCLDALELYSQHGAPAKPQNFNIYKRIVTDLLSSPKYDTYKTWAALRDVFFGLVGNMEANEMQNNENYEDFSIYLLISHYYAIRSACLEIDNMKEIVAKISTSLLRYTTHIPVDRAFYEAGLHCKKAQLLNMTFIFWNRLLDLTEAIDEGSIEVMDNSDFQGTDIPFEVPLPEKQYLSFETREEVRGWILTILMDQKLTQVLPMDERNCFEANLHSPTTNITSLPCIVTGYPVLRNNIDFRSEGRAANRDDWQKITMAAKTKSSYEIQDVFRFIAQYSGGLGSAASSYHN